MSDTYIIRWTIAGETRIQAESREDAHAKFILLRASDIADDGALVADDPVLEVRDDE